MDESRSLRLVPPTTDRLSDDWSRARHRAAVHEISDTSLGDEWAHALQVHAAIDLLRHRRMRLILTVTDTEGRELVDTDPASTSLQQFRVRAEAREIGGPLFALPPRVRQGNLRAVGVSEPCDRAAFLDVPQVRREAELAAIATLLDMIDLEAP
ncbi:hypothetical protein GYA93_17875 [Gordonia desulfuricans]|uniref:Uncharacterized protein n=1 Tax=Gordonia desulfuricans TaxID=89051 RepID=A0A7K3LT74_9ACTN|nr:hypothetical protein [Gordonia desulfuricans]NDK91432.1 hypothetical protein [Gordonia desulfuricans]